MAVKIELNSIRLRTSIVILWIFNLGGCSTPEINPKIMPQPPTYTKVPHPPGYDLADLASIFRDDSAPKDPNFSKDCDKEFVKLKDLTKSKREQEQGVKELVQVDPVNYHWCFYAKLLELEKEMKSEKYIDEKQKILLSTFSFLAPVAKSLLSIYHDSRYLRWATFRYKKMSEIVFYRKLDITPAGTSNLVQPASHFGLWRRNEDLPVLEKYHLYNRPGKPNPDNEIAQWPDAAFSPQPVPSTSASDTPVAAVSPSPTPTESVLAERDVAADEEIPVVIPTIEPIPEGKPTLAPSDIVPVDANPDTAPVPNPVPEPSASSSTSSAAPDSAPPAPVAADLPPPPPIPMAPADNSSTSSSSGLPALPPPPPIGPTGKASTEPAKVKK